MYLKCYVAFVLVSIVHTVCMSRSHALHLFSYLVALEVSVKLHKTVMRFTGI